MGQHDRSYWNATAPGANFPELLGDVEVDVAIVGGGIVGITTACFLKDSGASVAVIEALQVGRQATGMSTAKVTSQHGLRYQTLIQNFGEDNTALYAQAQECGLSTIRRLCETYRINCDMTPSSAYVYTLDRDEIGKIEQEAELTRRLGLPASLTHETGLPFSVLAAIRFDDQAQFHPTKYVAGLARTIPGDGCHVFENSRVIDWDTGRVQTARGSVRARHVVMATHLPLGKIGGYFAQAYPYAEPVIAAKIDRALEGMYITAGSPSRSIRSHTGADGDTYAIAAGERFKPGHPEDERKTFAGLESWLRQSFGVTDLAYRWVNEDYHAADQSPFIGWSSSMSDGYLIATGFHAWGITAGTAAARIIADLAMGQDNRWLPVFNATRVKPIAGGAEFVKENAGVAQHLVSGYLSRKLSSVEEVAPGEAAIVKVGSEEVAAFRDESGRVHAVSAACTHMGCLLGWNETDRTWDCSCHGSRFELDGRVIRGPATRALAVKGEFR